MEENKDINAIIGQNLLKLRKNMKLTQMEVAEKFNYSDKSISKWEKGESLPSIEVLYELSQFYGVTLDDLIHEIDDDDTYKTVKESKKEKTPTPRMFPARLMITLLSVGGVWLVATVLFVLLKIFLDINYYMSFMWAGVASCIVLLVFNSIWGKMRYLFVILTVLLWLTLGSLQLQLLFSTHINIWPVFFLGIPLQVLIVLWGGLVKKPKGFYKQNKQQNIKETTEN